MPLIHLHPGEMFSLGWTPRWQNFSFNSLKMPLHHLSLVLFLGGNQWHPFSVLFWSSVCLTGCFLNIFIFVDNIWTGIWLGHDFMGFSSWSFYAYDSLSFSCLLVYGSRQSWRFLTSSAGLCILPRTCRARVACLLVPEVASGSQVSFPFLALDALLLLWLQAHKSLAMNPFTVIFFSDFKVLNL